MYISRPILTLLMIVYLLFLLSMDWINSAGSGWYRPFILAFALIGVAAWLHREQDVDEL
ncbi:MAG: hypothetical protein RLZZ385_465 [Pseudomonadota bacterium]|jgi:hypothetical protein